MRARELIRTLQTILKVNDLKDCDVDCSVDLSIEGDEETYRDRCFGFDLMKPVIGTKVVDGGTKPCIILLYENHEIVGVYKFRRDKNAESQ